MAGLIPGQINKLSGYAPYGLYGFGSILHKNYVIMSVLHKNDQRGGQDYKSPEMMITDVAAECGFATSDPKQYGVGIDSYQYDTDL